MQLSQDIRSASPSLYPENSALTCVWETDECQQWSHLDPALKITDDVIFLDEGPAAL